MDLFFHCCNNERVTIQDSQIQDWLLVCDENHNRKILSNFIINFHLFQLIALVVIMDSAIIQTNAGTHFINVVLFIAYQIGRPMTEHQMQAEVFVVISETMIITSADTQCLVIGFQSPAYPMERTYVQKLFSNEKYLFISAVSMAGRDLIALNA